jgi:dihydroneopterin aldolase
MDDEIAAAFAHPEARLDLIAPGARVPDRISLRGHVREAEIGAFEGERGVTQRLLFDVAVEVEPAAPDDDVDRILSYDRLVEAIDAELRAGRVALLETMAERVADRILRQPQALRAIIRVQKLDRGPGALGVEVVRERGKGDATGEAGLRPRLLVLGEAEARRPELPKALHLLAEDAPLLVVAPPARAPKARTRAARERVSLLAADQGAWTFAARHPSLAVAGTLAEIDWLLRSARMAVWAPAKVSLDEGWGGLDPLGRALFMGERLGAREVLTAGIDMGGLVEAPVRVRRADLEQPLDQFVDWLRE